MIISSSINAGIIKKLTFYLIDTESNYEDFGFSQVKKSNQYDQ